MLRGGRQAGDSEREYAKRDVANARTLLDCCVTKLNRSFRDDQRAVWAAERSTLPSDFSRLCTPRRMHLSALYHYPIKSVAAVSVDAIDIEPRGPRGDRRWMIVDPAGKFVTGRQLPQMVRLFAANLADGVRIEREGRSAIDVAFPDADAPRRDVTVWGDTVAALDAGDAAAAWLGDALGRDVRLVHMDAAAHRAVDAKYAQPGDEVSFADGFPLLAISQAALDALNARLQQPIDMRRFRPNLVVGGTEPHAEDGWRRIRIGAIEFDVVKPCTRCVFTTVDPDRGALAEDGEPLHTLKTYRRSERGITFGMNVIARGVGTVRVGDAVEVIE